MRTLLKVRIDTVAGNQAIQDGSIGRLLEQLMDRLKPEAAYFALDNGCRAFFVVYDMKDPSELPPALEPLFIGLNAQTEVMPVMNVDDLRKGLGQLQSETLAGAGRG